VVSQLVARPKHLDEVGVAQKYCLSIREYAKESNRMNDREWTEYIKTHTRDEINTEAAKTKCSVCGKSFDFWDIALGSNRLDFYAGYGSRHDGERFVLNFCRDCFDKVLDMVLSVCAESTYAKKSRSRRGRIINVRVKKNDQDKGEYE